MLRWLSIAALVVGGACCARAQVVPTPEQQKALEQICLAKARSEMFVRVGGLRLREGVTVTEWLVRDADLDRALRLWVRTRPAEGPMRLYSDAVGEVDVRLLPAEVLRELVTLIEDYPSAASEARVDARQAKAAADKWPILWTTGRATVTKETRTGQPPGWEDVDREGTELARAAATADAQNSLLAVVGRLKVSSSRRVQEFLDSSGEVRQAVQAELQRAAKVKVDFAPDQVAVVEVRVGMRDLLRILTRVFQEHYHGDEFEVADFREMVLLAGQDDVVADGLATPPSDSILHARYEPIELDVPDWAGKALTVAGRFVPEEGESEDPAAQAAAARLDGIAQLGRQIEQLVIQRAVTVGEFLGYHQELKDDVALFLTGARAVSLPAGVPGGGVEVKIELPLRRLWDIVRRDMKVEEVEPQSAPTSAPGRETR
jgi:hypothetical protein